MIQKNICIIGAGISGLSACYQLLQHNKQFQITLIEKSFKVSGRATTRVKDGFIYDTGATTLSYTHVQNHQKIKSLIDNVTNDQIQIQNKIYIFDKDNKIEESGNIFNNLDKIQDNFGFKNGIISFGNGLHKQCQKLGANFLMQQNAIKMKQLQQGWEVQYQLDQTHLKEKKENIIQKQIFDQVLISMPAIQTLNFLKNSEFIQNDNKLDFIVNELQKVEYISQLSVVLALKKKVKKPYYGMVNLDKQNEISWLHFEDQKEGHAPDNQSLIIVQMSHDYSTKNYNNQDQQQIIQFIIEKLKLLNIDIDQNDLAFQEIKKWKYALPNIKDEYKDINQKNIGLFFTGDYTKSRGRVLLACEAGLDVADTINSYNMQQKL